MSTRAARYGDTAEECGEAFFLCGKSLLELARLVNLIAHLEKLFILQVRCYCKIDTMLHHFMRWFVFCTFFFKFDPLSSPVRSASVYST